MQSFIYTIMEVNVNHFLQIIHAIALLDKQYGTSLLRALAILQQEPPSYHKEHRYGNAISLIFI